jgi:predicted CXXCH cytochrome family protein
MTLRKILDYWWVGPLVALFLFGYFGYRMLSPDKQSFLPGKTTSGHHQIELACTRCHTPFGGVKQQACLDCHGAGLDAELDSHAPSIFNDPRSFGMLEVIDARQCISCHGEHIAELTQDKVANVPKDFCFPCHKDIASERPSHKGLSADGCAASGCHNYHDNQALYEDFLAKHLDEDRLLLGPSQTAVVMSRSAAARPENAQKALTSNEQDGKNHVSDMQLIQDWAASRHARAGVNCSDCHEPAGPPAGVSTKWSDHPSLEVCKNCHDHEAKGFLEGKHGMRIAAGLSPMSPSQARMPMKSDAHDKVLTCNTCHGAHRYDTRQAAEKSCSGCHDDIHSKAYSSSPHHKLWQAELSGSAPEGSGVSCATCHMPRAKVKEEGGERIAVTHNQNANLRPNSKMIRTVCLECHGLGFTLEALADPDLLLNNYSGTPKKRIESLEMVRKRRLDKVRERK